MQTTQAEYRVSDSTDGYYTVPLTSRMSIRIYKDTRPNNLETSAIQKGLVLMLDGKELIEEGVGFGVPIVKYADKTFFSTQAQTSLHKSGADYVITKVFTLDTVSIKKVGQATYIDDAIYSTLRKAFATLYLKHKSLTALFNKLMELRQLANVKTEFLTVKPRGQVAVTFLCKPNLIQVKADFSKIALNKCTSVLVLNEQGASTFQNYCDTNGLKLSGNKIGPWDDVTADWAMLHSPSGRLMFSLQSGGDATLFRGWEFTWKRFSWAGLSYSMPPHNGVFEYSIRIGVLPRITC